MACGWLKTPVVGASALVLAWPAVYPAVLWAIAQTRPRKEPIEPSAIDLPSLTVILPTYQERETIETRLINLTRCDYPRDRFEVIVVDSGSTDGTASIAESFARATTNTRIRVIRETERAGKSSAINLGLDASTTDIVAVTDATTSFEKDTLLYVATCFQDPEVGAATGYFEVTGRDRAMETEEKDFWRVRNLLRSLEAQVDSTPFLSGELTCFRRNLVKALDVDSLADDMNVALQVRRRGYRVVIDERSRFSEPRTAVFEELSQTKSRRAAGGIQELLRNRDLAFNKRYGLFGMLIIPSAFVYYLPLRLPALAVLGLMFKGRLGKMSPGMRAVTVNMAGMAAAKAGPKLKARLGLLLFNEWMFLLGWRRIFMNGMDVRWTQERTTRADHAAAAALEKQ